MNRQKDSGQAVVSLEHLEQTHRKISTMLKKLSNFHDKHLTNESLEFLKRLWISFSRCFGEEETLMQQINDEYTTVHHQQHELFLDYLSWSINSAQDNHCISKDFCLFINEWYRFHYDNLDKYLCGRNIAANT